MEYNYPAGLNLSNLQTTPTAKRAQIDSSKLRIKLEWRDVSDGTMLSASFVVSSDTVGDYALTPRKVQYEFADRTRVKGTGNTSVVHVTTPSVNQPPIADAGPDQTVEASSAAGAAVTFDGAGSSDPDGDALTFSWTGSFGSAVGVSPTMTIPVGSQTVTLTVTDTSSSAGSDTVQITVQDTTAPTLSNVPPDQTIEATSAAGAVYNYTAPTATDTVDPSPTVSCNPASGSTLTLGTTIITCTATDANTNSSQATFTLSV